jgi:hypothetical protein
MGVFLADELAMVEEAMLVPTALGSVGDEGKALAAGFKWIDSKSVPDNSGQYVRERAFGGLYVRESAFRGYADEIKYFDTAHQTMARPSIPARHGAQPGGHGHGLYILADRY